MQQGHLTINFTPAAMTATGLQLDQAMLLGMEDVLDLIDKFNLIGMIEHGQLVVRTGPEFRADVVRDEVTDG
jgi:hypothetical protein